MREVRRPWADVLLKCYRGARRHLEERAVRRRPPLYSEAKKKPEWQRNQGLPELGRGARAEEEAEEDLDLDLHREVGGQVGKCSGTVSHNDERGQQLTELRRRDGPSFGLAALLPAPGQLGLGRRGELHRRARSGYDERDLLLLLVFHAVLFSQLTVHSHGFTSEEGQVSGIAGSEWWQEAQPVR